MRYVEQAVKQAVRRTIGEPYVGKRIKQRWLVHALATLEFNPARILDAGAEDATFTYWLADRYPHAQVTALDIDRSAMEACLATRPRRYASRVDFVAGAFADVDHADFDLVVAFDVLEHIQDDAAALRELREALRPGGTLLLHVPTNPYTDHRGRQQWVPDEQAWRINVGHVRHGYPPTDLRRLVQAAGFEVRSVERWNRRWAARAHAVYARLEHPRALRLLSIPVTDLCAVLDRRRPPTEGNTVWLVAQRPEDPGMDARRGLAGPDMLQEADQDDRTSW